MRHWHLIVRLFYTLWPMLPLQWIYLVYYRLLRKKIAPCRIPVEMGTRQFAFREFPVLPQHRLQGDRFVFLNVEAPWPLTDIDWDAAEQKKLWRYNLHYFDWLREPEPYTGAWLCSMHDWIERVPFGVGDAWEPYPLSLRIVNWIKWLAQHPEQATDVIKASLYQQCHALEQQLEFHIQANHLYKNAIALLFAGRYFKDARAQRWFQRGQQLCLAETRRQFLADGGHFERSPLYHSLCLEDLLDVVNLYACENREIPDPIIGKVAVRALYWLVQLCDPQGDIVLLNDSAWGIAPTPSSLCDYAFRLGLTVERQPAWGLTALQQSGYFIYRNDTVQLLFDVSDVGPAFQPGHTHCDMLSFLVWHRGMPLFIDSGVGSYLDDDDRRYARATRAHNTVTIDHQEQSDIWSAFRVAERARITHATQVWEGETLMLKGAHDGYSRYWRGVMHWRTLEYQGNVLRIIDTLEGQSTRAHVLSIYFHLSPHHQIVIQGNYCVVSQADGRVVARLAVPAGMVATLLEQPFFPEFGKQLQHPVILLSCTTRLPFTVETNIQLM